MEINSLKKRRRVVVKSVWKRMCYQDDYHFLKRVWKCIKYNKWAAIQFTYLSCCITNNLTHKNWSESAQWNTWRPTGLGMEGCRREEMRLFKNDWGSFSGILWGWLYPKEMRSCQKLVQTFWTMTIKIDVTTRLQGLGYMSYWMGMVPIH